MTTILSPQQQAVAVLDKLELQPSDYFIGGSGPMALRNMRHLRDLDLGLTTAYWFELLLSNKWGLYTPLPNLEHERCDPPFIYKTVEGVEVHAFFAWRLREHQPARDSDYNVIFREYTEMIAGWRCVTLPLLLRLKSQEQRSKDFADIAAIARQIVFEEGQDKRVASR